MWLEKIYWHSSYKTSNFVACMFVFRILHSEIGLPCIRWVLENTLLGGWGITYNEIQKKRIIMHIIEKTTEFSEINILYVIKSEIL